MIYNHGISFWYWGNKKSNKQCVVKRFQNLKEEILHFKKFTRKQWDNLVVECDDLIKTDRIRTISCNGHNTNVYEMQKDVSITVDHVYSIKLYTDYTWLCKIFCDAFRLKKISENQYERVRSLKRRNEKVANWAKLLMESVQCFGRLRITDKKYYRGVTKAFIFIRFIARFNVPLSTTIDFAKAVEFVQSNSGVVMELKRHDQFL
eukprot:69435_1